MKTQLKRKLTGPTSLRWFAVAGLAVCAAAYALTPANTVITNKAVVEYSDENGNTFDSESNPAEVTVGEVYAATISQDRLDFEGAPGQQVYIPYVIENNGNTTDTYTLTLATTLDELLGSGPLTDGYAGADLTGATVAIYPDNDGNGEPDSGSSPITGPVDIDGETIQQFVVAINVPGTAAADDEIGVVLTATSGNTTVNDLTPSNGVDALDETVAGRVTVSTDAVLVLTQSSVVSGSTLTYTLEVKNNGNTAATGVGIYDLMPYADVDGSGTLSTGDVKLAYIASSVSDAGLGNAGDVVADDVTDYTSAGLASADVSFNEVTAGVDLNDDGDTTDTFGDIGTATETPIDELTGIYAEDASIAQNVTISVTYSVTIPSTVPVGTNILNTFCVTADLDGAGAAGDTSQCSNETIDQTPQVYGVNVGDTSPDDDGVVNAGDDDGLGSVTYEDNDEDDSDNDDQRINEASEGETITFFAVVENTGNGPDTFTVDASTAEQFPVGTTFVYKDATGSVLSGGDTTPSIAAGGSVVIQVMAMLPTGLADGDLLGDGVTSLEEDPNGLFCVAVGTGGFCDDADATPFETTLTATSEGDPSSTDTTTLSLGTIAVATADLADTVVTDPYLTANEDYILANHEASGNYQPDGGASDGTEAPTSIYDSNIPGDTVTLSFAVHNETGGSDTFLFDLEYLGYDDGVSAFDEDDDSAGIESASAGELPPGWSVAFFDSTGAPASSTSLVADDGYEEFTAVVTIPSNPAQAPIGDYDVRVSIASNATGDTDSVVNRIEIVEDCSIELTQGQTDSIQAGGTVDFDHILRNTGNTTEDLEVESVFAGTPSGWSQILQIETATGFVDYAAGVVANVYAPGAATTTQPIVAQGTGEVTIELAPNEYVNLRVRVFTSALASDGTTEDVTLTATPFGSSSCTAVVNTDTVEVIDRQVRITKTVAVDTDCNCVADDGLFSETATSDVNPGQCVIWKLEAENQGTEPALNVVIRDAITDFTTLASAVSVNSSTASSNELQSCVSSFLVSGCVSDEDTGQADDEAAAHNLVNGSAANVDGSLISFPIGQIDSDTAAAAAVDGISDTDRTDGGTLLSGDSGVGMFCVVVD